VRLCGRVSATFTPVSSTNTNRRGSQ
jgi:hypothetical protein